MQISQKNFIIIDFTASKKYFHQYPLIIGLSNILLRNGYSSQILLPTNADKGEIEHANKNINYILDSGDSSRNYKPLRHLIHKLIFLSSNFNLPLDNIRKILRKNYIKSSLRYLNNVNKDKINHIIFPTLDPLALELAVAISKRSQMTNFFFSFRIVGRESRGILASNSELKKLLELIDLFPNKIKIGIETDGYKSYLQNHGFSTGSLSWAPWPSLKSYEEDSTNTKNFTIGFLGCAKKRKGFDNIPKIIEVLKISGLIFDVLVQEANFPWLEYESSKNAMISLMGDNLEMLSSSLDLIDLQKFIGRCDLLILPYDSNSYAIGASGLMYHACDSSIPIIVAKGVGFESEMLAYEVGLTYNDVEEIPLLVRCLQSKKWNFVAYNDQRNDANQKFLLE
jgi:hypothetical protein